LADATAMKFGSPSRNSTFPGDLIPNSTTTRVLITFLILQVSLNIIEMSVDVPHTQKAFVVQNPGENYTIVLQDNIPVPEPRPGEILIKLECTGLW